MLKQRLSNFANIPVIGCAGLLLLALGSQSVAAAEAALTRAMVDQSNVDYAVTVVSGAVDSIQYRYSEDALLIGHAGLLLQGRVALNKHFKDSLKVRPKSVTVTTLSLEKAGDKYIEVGESRGEGASGSTWLGHYMSIWILQDGQWLIEKNIYN